MSKLITKETLEKWHACPEGAERFNELWPDGADLATASAGLIADGHKAWSDWLWSKCAKDSEYCQQTVIAAGDGGTATAGNGGTATAGYRGTATAGNGGTATAGDGGTATAGYRGTATAGYRGTATAGEGGTATAGNGGTATAGDGGTATAGDGGTATAGYRGTATAGDGGTATAGENGCLVLKHYSEGRYFVRCANVGVNGIKPKTAYKLDDAGKKFVKVEK